MSEIMSELKEFLEVVDMDNDAEFKYYLEYKQEHFQQNRILRSLSIFSWVNCHSPGNTQVHLLQRSMVFLFCLSSISFLCG